MRHESLAFFTFIFFSSLGCGGTGQTPTTGAQGATSSGASGSGAGGHGGASSSASGAGGGQAATVLRFAALGDGGEGNATQAKVAGVMQAECAKRGGCEFALYLGDNFYNSGVSGVSDNQFQTKFEIPYAVTSFRFFVVLGNHDYGGNGAGFEFLKGQAQIDYSSMSSKWTMPKRYYQFSTPADAGPAKGPVVDFFGLDTNAIMFTGDAEQRDWLEAAVAASTAGWKIGFGHHPYISNGKHGNAGTYEGIPFVPIVSGSNVKDFFDDTVCQKVDVYISGHDHNRQWLKPACGVEFIVSGTAAKTTALAGRGTPTFFEKDQSGGFLLAEIEGNTFTGTFFDENGAVEFTRKVTK